MVRSWKVRPIEEGVSVLEGVPADSRDHQRVICTYIFDITRYSSLHECRKYLQKKGIEEVRHRELMTSLGEHLHGKI